MYMREMGTVELLTREGEIAIAKRIEEGLRELLHAIAVWPGSVKNVLDEYDLVEKGERRLTDVIAGWLDPFDPVTPAPIVEPPAATKDTASKGAGEKETDDDDAEEAQLGTAQDCPCSPFEWRGSNRVHSGRRA